MTQHGVCSERRLRSQVPKTIALMAVFGGVILVAGAVAAPPLTSNQDSSGNSTNPFDLKINPGPHRELTRQPTAQVSLETQGSRSSTAKLQNTGVLSQKNPSAQKVATPSGAPVDLKTTTLVPHNTTTSSLNSNRPTVPAFPQVNNTSTITNPPPVGQPNELLEDTQHPAMALPTKSVEIPNQVSHGEMGRYLWPYRVRASEVAEEEPIDLVDPRQMFAASSTGSQVDSLNNAAAMADGFQMWWEPELMQPIGFTEQSLQVNVAALTQAALASSPHIQSLLTRPHIRRSDVVIADSEFDPTVYLEGRFTDTNEPVGSELTTGDNSDRFRDKTLDADGGIRKKTRRGGELELAQRGGFQSNNSTFLDPNPQGTTRLEFNFTQPLMRDRGEAVNNIHILLAQLNVQINNAEIRNDLENHLVEVTRAYWDLYMARAQWLQRKRLLAEAARLNQILEARENVDSHQRQILRARAALATRKSDLVRLTTRIRDIQSRLRLLTGSPQLTNAGPLELTPQDKPMAYPIAVSTRQSVITALDNRPDLAKAIRRIQVVSARVGVARNQVLPRLDLILGTYVSGLDSRRDTFGAWKNQFSDGRPTYWAGLAYEIPVGNRASRARLNRNRWELTQVVHDFQQTTELAFTEVEVAVRETKTAYHLMVAKSQAIGAAAHEVEFLRQRWELLPDPNESAVLLIEDLLDAQERLADEEQAFVEAQVAYAISWIQLRKATGVLLRFDDGGVDSNNTPLGTTPVENVDLTGAMP